jgi:hypothetical protein
MDRMRRLISVCAAAIWTTAAAAQKTHPMRPVRIIVPYPAGQATDILRLPGGCFRRTGSITETERRSSRGVIGRKCSPDPWGYWGTGAVHATAWGRGGG